MYLFELMELLRSHGHQVALFSMADARGTRQHTTSILSRTSISINICMVAPGEASPTIHLLVRRENKNRSYDP